MSFLPAWRAWRSDIEVLAGRAARKRDAARRVLVLHDTTAFKGAPIPRVRCPVATEPGFDTRLRQILLAQLAERSSLRHVACYERVAGLPMENMDAPLPLHVEQAHLAEW